MKGNTTHIRVDERLCTVHNVRAQSEQGVSIAEILRHAANYIEEEVRGEIYHITLTDDAGGQPMLFIFEWLEIDRDEEE